MKLGSFEINGTRHLGAFEDDRVIDLNAAYRLLLIEKGMSDPDQEADTAAPSDKECAVTSEMRVLLRY